MKTPWTSIVCFLMASLLGAIGQFLYKEGATRPGASWFSYLVNWRVFGGVVCYVSVMVLFLAAFRWGGSLSVLYPLYAMTFIWAALIAAWAYGERIEPINVLGMVLLLGGMYLMGR